MICLKRERRREEERSVLVYRYEKSMEVRRKKDRDDYRLCGFGGGTLCRASVIGFSRRTNDVVRMRACSGPVRAVCRDGAGGCFSVVLFCVSFLYLLYLLYLFLCTMSILLMSIPDHDLSISTRRL